MNIPIERAPKGALSLFKDDKSITRYVDILTNVGIEWGLLGPDEGERIWSRHVLNCAGLADLIPHGLSVADVGSGAGLPGIVLALMRPDLEITLIESLERRVEFLNTTVSDLGLVNQVSVRRARAEDVQDIYDVVTARAVANLSKLLRWTKHLIGRNGQLLALKGQSATTEVAKAKNLLKELNLCAEVLTVSALPETQPTWVVRVSRG